MISPDAIQPKIQISAIFPAFNDYATITSMVLATRTVLLRVCDDFEIIVTNDGSKDDTGLILDEMSKLVPELVVIHHDRNQGYGCALRSGFRRASKDWIFYTDGDGQYNPLELRVLLDAWTPDVDVVNGYKVSRGDTLLRKLIGRLYHHFVKLVFGFQLVDVNCDFRLIRRKLFDEVALESEDGSICLEMVKKFQDSGYRFVEVPVHHYPRPHGVSQFFRWKYLYRTAKSLYHLWFNIRVRH